MGVARQGTAHALGGDTQIDASGNVNGTVVIDAASFDTNNKKRDDHLRSDDFLEVIKYPTIVFTVNGGRPAAAGGFDITGVLTIHGHSAPITLQAEVSGTGSSATMSGEVEIDRSLWGMSWTKWACGSRIRSRFVPTSTAPNRSRGSGIGIPIIDLNRQFPTVIPASAILTLPLRPSL